MSLPRWGGLPEVTSKLSAEGIKSLLSVYLSVVDALNEGSIDESFKNLAISIKEESLLMQDAIKGIDNCVNVAIAAADYRIYDDLNSSFYKAHGKTVTQAIQELEEALHRVDTLVQGFKTVDEGVEGGFGAYDKDSFGTSNATYADSKDATSYDESETYVDDKGSTYIDDPDLIETTVFPVVR